MMKHATAVMAALALFSAPVFASDRLTDRDVKALAERIDDGRDKFEGALDDTLKNTVVRSATGEINVKRELDDFKESVSRMKDRLKPDYTASSEANVVLKRATDIDVFLGKQSAGFKGASEWTRLSTDLKSLAAAYGTYFPLPDNATVRRLGDREVATAVEQLAKVGD